MDGAGNGDGGAAPDSADSGHRRSCDYDKHGL